MKPLETGGFSRRVALRTALAAGSPGLSMPFLTRNAGAEEPDVRLRVGHTAPADFSLHERLVEAAMAVSRRSGGKVEMRIFPNGELGSPVGLLAQVRAGTLDCAILQNQVLIHDLATAATPMVGFAFSGYDSLWPAIDGELGDYVCKLVHDRLGLVVPSRCWDFGFRQVTTISKPVGMAGDLQDLRIRVPPETEFFDLFHALKALPIGMPLNGLQKALHSHAVDGQESLLPFVDATHLYFELSYCAMTNHIWDGQWACFSGKTWARLPAGTQDVITMTFNEAALAQREDTARNLARLRASMEESGMKFNAVDVNSFRQVLRDAGYYAALRRKVGDDAWEKLEKYAGRLT